MMTSKLVLVAAGVALAASGVSAQPVITYSSSMHPTTTCDAHGRYPAGTPCTRAEQNVDSTRTEAGQAQAEAARACPSSPSAQACGEAQRDATDAFNAQQQALYEQQQLEARDAVRLKQQQEDEEARQRSEELQRRAREQQRASDELHQAPEAITSP